MSTVEVQTPQIKTPVVKPVRVKKVLVGPKKTNKTLIIIIIIVVILLIGGGIGAYFALTKEKTWVNKGCFKDEVLRAQTQNDPKRAIPMYVHPVTTLEECKAIAARNNANVIGLQNGNECWYGRDPNYSRYGAETGACPALGGPMVNNVYVLE